MDHDPFHPDAQTMDMAFDFSKQVARSEQHALFGVLLVQSTPEWLKAAREPMTCSRGLLHRHKPHLTGQMVKLRAPQWRAHVYNVDVIAELLARGVRIKQELASKKNTELKRHQSKKECK